MSTTASQEKEKREKYVPEWVWEVLIFVTVSPAIVHALYSFAANPLA